MDRPPEPPPDEGSPENDEAHGEARPRVAATVPEQDAHEEAPVAVRPARAARVSPTIDETAPDLPDVTEVPPAAATPDVPGTQDAPRAAPGKGPDAPAPPARRRRWPRVVAGVAGVLIGVAVAVALIAPGYIRGRIVEEARARGIEIEFQDMDVGFSLLQLEGVKVALAGVPDVAAQAAHVEVDLEDWQPRAVRARGLAMTLFGTEALDHLSAWKNKNPSALATPIDASGATVAWHPAKGAAAALSLGDAHVAVEPEKGTIDSKQAVFVGRPAGPVRAAWDAADGGLAVEIRPLAAPLSAITIDIVAAKDASPRERPKVSIALARTKLAPLQAALGIPKGSEALEAEGELTMPLPSLAKPEPIDGALRLSVKGYVPPHPKELDGILFGDVTKVQAYFTLAPDFAKARLSQVDVEAGALALRGLGDVDREGFDANVALTLKGTVPCSALATSAAVAHLGEDWGRLAGGLAGGALRGNVSVVITVEARASDIQHAKIDRSAHLGCKVSVPGLPTIVLK